MLTYNITVLPSPLYQRNVYKPQYTYVYCGDGVMERKEMQKVHMLIDKNIYQKLWEISARRFEKPGRKLYIIINEALKEYVEKHQ